MKKYSLGFLTCLAVLFSAVGARAQWFAAGKWTPGQLRFSQDGTRLWATFDNYTPEKWQHAVRSWDVESGRLASHAVLPGVMGGWPYLSLFCPTGNYYAHRMTPILKQGKLAPTTIRDIITGAIVSTPEVTDATALPLAFSPDDKLLVGVSVEKSPAPQVLKTWDTATGKAVPLFDAVGENERVSHIFFSVDNRLVVRLGWKMNSQHKVRRWAVVFDRATGKKTAEYYLDDKGLGDFALVSQEDEEEFEGLGATNVTFYGDWRYELSPDGRHLAGVPSQPVANKLAAFAVLWDTQTGAQVRQLPIEPGAADFGRLHFSADGSQLTAIGVSASKPGQKLRRQTWETATGKELSASELPFQLAYPFDGATGPLAVSTTHSRWFAQFTNRETIEIYSLENGELVRTIEVGDF